MPKRYYSARIEDRQNWFKWRKEGRRMKWHREQPEGSAVCKAVGLCNRFISCLDPQLWIYHQDLLVDLRDRRVIR